LATETNPPAPARITARRASGVLLQPTALAGPGIGDLGSEAHRFVDWLADAGQRYWQILPLGPVDAGGSPYNGLSALAGNPLLISPEMLVREGLVGEEAVAEGHSLPAERIDFPAVFRWKDTLHRAAFSAFIDGAAPHLEGAFREFRRRNDSWLPDYTLFRALRDEHGGRPWTAWPAALRSREPGAVERARRDFETAIGRYAFQQFLFDRQWNELRGYAAARGVRVIGDLPIFVAHDSADVWANREIFQLDPEGEPRVVAGVPPDYFSETGQRWGNPLYRWDVLRDRGYDWWLQRFRRTFSLVDYVRIDHFRGFQAYWEIPAEEATAVRGRWVEGPGEEFFRAVQRELGDLPVIAEDLGQIDDAVLALRDALGFPGMRVLQFGFDGDPANLHHPGNYPADAIAYTGTHDNDTTLGWWRSASDAEREQLRDWIGISDPSPWDLIEGVSRTAARLLVVPVQDVLGLGSEARMNVPGSPVDSWAWRLPRAHPGAAAGARLREIGVATGRVSEDG
jgi:4-alpha-glucanotransferase